jgi:hypothetical protein
MQIKPWAGEGYSGSQTFLMVAIRNLYWTGGIAAFIFGGLILARTLCGVVGAAPGGVRAAGPKTTATRDCRRLTNRSFSR